MATLPSPTGGMNPWGAILQRPPESQQQGVNPLIATMMQNRQDRMGRESDERTAALNQAGQIAPYLGGSGIISTLEQLLQAGGSVPEGFNIDDSYAMVNDPAQVRATNAESTLRQGQAMAQAGSVGMGLDLASDATIRQAGPDADVLNAVIGQASASAPRSYTFSGQNTRENENTDTITMPVRLPDGTMGYREVKRSDLQKWQAEGEGPTLPDLPMPGGNASGSGMPSDDIAGLDEASNPESLQVLNQLIKGAYGQQYMALPPSQDQEGNVVFPIYNMQDKSISDLTEDDLRQIQAGRTQ